jgi:DNA ligase-associated metallophosphoesterase
LTIDDWAEMVSDGRIEIELAGERVVLLAARALYWAAEATLFLADPHFGKSDSFQAAGLPVPSGATADDLVRLSRCLDETGAQRLVILGDFFHTRASQSGQVIEALEAWRRRHPTLSVTLIAGNHDRHAGPPPEGLNIESVGEPYVLGPFACHHEPPQQQSQTPTRYALAGHVHPVAALRDVDGTRLRLPCFHVGQSMTVLPAFGAFTGGHAVRAVRGDRIFALVDQGICEVRTA